MLVFVLPPKESDKNNDSKSDKNDIKVDSDHDKRKVEDKAEKDDKNVLNAGIATLNLCQQNVRVLENSFRHWIHKCLMKL